MINISAFMLEENTFTCVSILFQVVALATVALIRAIYVGTLLATYMFITFVNICAQKTKDTFRIKLQRSGYSVFFSLSTTQMNGQQFKMHQTIRSLHILPCLTQIQGVGSWICLSISQGFAIQTDKFNASKLTKHKQTQLYSFTSATNCQLTAFPLWSTNITLMTDDSTQTCSIMYALHWHIHKLHRGIYNVIVFLEMVLPTLTVLPIKCQGEASCAGTAVGAWGVFTGLRTQPARIAPALIYICQDRIKAYRQQWTHNINDLI